MRRRQSGPAVRREKVELDGGDRAGKVLLAGVWGAGGGCLPVRMLLHSCCVSDACDALSTARGH